MRLIVLVRIIVITMITAIISMRLIIIMIIIIKIITSIRLNNDGEAIAMLLMDVISVTVTRAMTTMVNTIAMNMMVAILQWLLHRDYSFV